MKEEVNSAAKFISEKVKEQNQLSDEHGVLFQQTLEELLIKRFENHWHPEKPLKGNAYRCVNINLEECCIDPILREAAAESLIEIDDLTASFPGGLALWIDPYDVSYRLGRGAICPVYRRFNPYKVQKDIPRKARYSNYSNAKPQIVVPRKPKDSKLNSEAPVFTPKTIPQDLSSIWTKNTPTYVNSNYQSQRQLNSGNNCYSYFQKDNDQVKYNRYHWHRDDKQQNHQTTGFEFRNFVQEVC
eukprot:gene10951-12112_t